jgi:hypothetical protein
MEEEGWEEGNR